MLLVTRMLRDRLSFDALGRFAVRRRWWIVAAWAVVLLAALPFAPRAPAALSAGGFILDDLESARAKQLLQDELGVEPSAFVLAVHLRHADRRHARRGRRPSAAATRDVAGRAARDPRSCRTPRAAPGRPPTATPPTTSCSSTSRPTTRPTRIPGVRGRLHQVAGPDRPDSAAGPAFYGDVQAVSETDLRRSELISLPLAALALLLVFGSLVAAGVPLAVGGAAVLVALAAIFVVGVADADEHLRAQPRDAARARPRRRLLAADDQPLPRGAGATATGRTGSPRRVRVDGRDGRRAVFFSA